MTYLGTSILLREARFMYFWRGLSGQPWTCPFCDKFWLLNRLWQKITQTLFTTFYNHCPQQSCVPLLTALFCKTCIHKHSGRRVSNTLDLHLCTTFFMRLLIALLHVFGRHYVGKACEAFFWMVTKSCSIFHCATAWLETCRHKKINLCGSLLFLPRASTSGPPWSFWSQWKTWCLWLRP